jgi:hypothetical protein
VEDWVLIALVGFAVGLVVGRWWWTLFVAPIPVPRYEAAVRRLNWQRLLSAGYTLTRELP